ncbi:hypothetical protein B0H67DRAFT_639153 [Lasiosphaeris hirsuta]|uniref:PWWP domain-containing protein n=1 Tax=Lasiosphaeris hirsuta TaxID=260670 RepID=A0AA40BAI1_9PEZI|nr:hypothetical protein B0H67DRAFT_639153 [Lasiosphaeris hirsuta]
MSAENSTAPATGTAQPSVTTDDAPSAPAASTSKSESAKETSADADVETKATNEAGADGEALAPKESSKAAEATAEKSEPPADAKSDVDMADASAPADAPAADADESTASVQADAAATTPGNKGKGKQRKSIGAADKGKKLNKKASRAKILHLDAAPGDHYFVKLKGFPQWPVIICDEDMLPQSLLKSRPVTARRADGTYREDYADGGKRAGDRTFPVMYLHTNEFGWVPNSDLIELDPSTVKDVKIEKRKDLQAAHELASQSHPLSFYKDLLHQYQEDLIEQEKAKAAKAATPSKSKKTKAPVGEDDDIDMPDADEVDEDTTPVKEKKPKKRKAEDTAETPQRSESVKKPKIKLTVNSTPKTANGTAPAPKSTKVATEGKATKAKSKKAKETEEKVENEVVAPKEPELSPEEKHARKKKEVLFLRHKLQKGLLTREQAPKEEEMKLMSEYILKLEAFPDLEVSIIRGTKINKVLKAILKLENIPKEEEFQFKSRSTSLLEKWNKLLAVDGTAAEKTNGVNGTTTSKEPNKTNGVKSEAIKDEDLKDEDMKDEDKTEEESAEKPAAKEAKTEEAVEASA